jgi:hypothetical protein
MAKAVFGRFEDEKKWDAEERLFLVGTRYHYLDLYGHLIKNELAGKHQVIRAIAADGTTPWPEKFSLEWLEERRRQMGSAIFATQYQNDVELMKGDIFREAWFRYYEVPPDWSRFEHWIGCDPAATRADVLLSGRKAESDWWTIVVGARTKDKVSRAYWLQAFFENGQVLFPAPRRCAWRARRSSGSRGVCAALPECEEIGGQQRPKVEPLRTRVSEVGARLDERVVEIEAIDQEGDPSHPAIILLETKWRRIPRIVLAIVAARFARDGIGTYSPGISSGGIHTTRPSRHTATGLPACIADAPTEGGQMPAPGSFGCYGSSSPLVGLPLGTLARTAPNLARLPRRARSARYSAVSNAAIFSAAAVVRN